MPPLAPPPVPPFETNRLRVRDWAAELGDPERRQALEAALAGILTPPVLAPLPAPLQLPAGPTALSDWLAARAGESHVCTVALKADAVLIGLLILAPFAQDGAPATIHLGYLIAEAAWGQGYATELLAGLVAGLDPRAEVTLVAGAARDNPASIRVLEKSGFAICTRRSTGATAVFVRTLP